MIFKPLKSLDEIVVGSTIKVVNGDYDAIGTIFKVTKITNRQPGINLNIKYLPSLSSGTWYLYFLKNYEICNGLKKLSSEINYKFLNE